ncbi:MAG: FAD:protein FMN transferase, partial [Planctomycetota bacterium]
MHRGVGISIILGVAVGVIALMMRARSPGSPAAYHSITREIMASPITVVAPADVASEAADVVFGVFDDIDAEMSEWKPGSALSAVNDAAGDRPVAVPEPLLGVIERGLEIGAMTDGAFDITWAALWGLWD